MRSTLTLILVLSLLPTMTISGQQPLKVVTNSGGPGKVTPEASYGLGFNAGTGMAGGGIQAGDIAVEDFVKGLMDGLAGKKPSIDQEKLQQAMQQLTQVLNERRKSASAKFLAENKKKDGVVVTDSGLQYEVLKSGNGATPTAQSRVTVHYEGRFTSGRMFESSRQSGQPATFGVTQVIKGWTEALLSMKVGDQWRLVIPSDLAYGPQGNEFIPPDETLIFDIELLSVQ